MKKIAKQTGKLSRRIVACHWCKHQWFTSLAGRDPVSCPKCHSFYWNKPDAPAPFPRKQKG